MVGFYLDAQGTVRSFVKDRHGRVTRFAVRGVPATFAGSVNDRGQIVIPELGTGPAPVAP